MAGTSELGLAGQLTCKATGPWNYEPIFTSDLCKFVWLWPTRGRIAKEDDRVSRVAGRPRKRSGWPRTTFSLLADAEQILVVGLAGIAPVEEDFGFPCWSDFLALRILTT